MPLLLFFFYFITINVRPQFNEKIKKQIFEQKKKIILFPNAFISSCNHIIYANLSFFFLLLQSRTKTLVHLISFEVKVDYYCYSIIIVHV